MGDVVVAMAVSLWINVGQEIVGRSENDVSQDILGGIRRGFALTDHRGDVVTE